MSKTREVLNRINSILKTKKITQAMKMISISKLSKYQTKSENFKIYSDNFNYIFNKILLKIKEHENDIEKLLDFKKKKTNTTKKLLLIVSSDKGLCSSFNFNLFKKVDEYLIDNKNINISLLTIGKKGLLNYQKSKYLIYNQFVDSLNVFNYKTIVKIVNFLISKYESGEYSEILIASNTSKGKSERIIKLDTYLPFEINQEFITKLLNYHSISENDFIFEPKENELINTLYPKLLRINLYETLLKSIVSEHSARVMAMTKATDNADDMIKELRLTYNRTRQGNITKELSEIVGGAEALKGGH